MPLPNKRTRGAFRLEHRTQRPVPASVFLLRLAAYVAGAGLLVLSALAIGMVGYHVLENFSWLDAFLNAAMILGGMGPVAELHTAAGKLFAGIYALFSGLVFLSGTGLVFAPLLHRLLHRFHFEADSAEHGQ